MGVTLMHEHILLDASGKWVPPCCCSDRHLAELPVKMENLGELSLNPLMSRDNCQLFDVDVAIDELMKYRALGGETVVDPTNIGIGRDPKALARIARLTGLNIIMGTGLYLEPSHPEWVKNSSIEQLTERLMYDLGGAEKKPEVLAGLIGEIGISSRFTPDEEKSLRAAGRASAATGVPIEVHLPGWERLGHRVLDILEQEGADLRHTVLCHMNPSFADKRYQRELAQRGAFLEYDMIGMSYYYADESVQSPSDEENARAIRELIDDGYIQQILLSQDVFLKTMLTRYGGHGYGYILKHFVPRLRRHGISGEQLETLMIGFDQFATTTWHTGATDFLAALADSPYAVTYMPAHAAATDFPLMLEALQEWDAIILSDIGANTLLLHPDTWLKSRRTANRLTLLHDYVAGGGSLMMIGGYYSFQGINGGARYRHTAVEKVLPVRCLAWDDRVETPEGCYAEVAESHTLLNNIPGEWPWLLGYNEVEMHPEGPFAGVDQRHVGTLAAGRVYSMARLSPAMD
ncbi:Phosphotriesterase-related protein [Beauveria bassiana D1-5]|uniref:Phosphotriesterase-related protein n=1 Tax=Beauveria bassiana D1-5 TaxID=1245745 RepID=A0A0A2VZN3_BEABA|nr:Phosphotriesterase-related protein [Beauveria bassiana D1-5]